MSVSESFEAHPSVRSVANLTLVEDQRPVMPMVAEMLDRTQRSRPVTGHIIGSVDGCTSRVAIAETMVAAGLSVSAKSAYVRSGQVSDVLNEIALDHQGQPLIVTAGDHALSASPYLADDFLVLRRELRPDLPLVEPRAVIAPELHDVYGVVEQEGLERTKGFAHIIDRADILTDHLRRPRQNPPELTAKQAVLHRLVDVVRGSRLPDDATIPITGKQFVSDIPGATTSTLSSVGDSVELWFGDMPLEFELANRGQGRRVNGVKPGVVRQISHRFDEVQAFRDGARLTVADRYEFWQGAEEVNQFLSLASPRPPRPGEMPIRQSLAVSAALDLMPNLQSVATQSRQHVLHTEFNAYLRMFGVLDPNHAAQTARGAKNLIKALVNKQTADLTDGACLGINPGIMYPEKDDEVGEQDAKMVCAKCPVKEDCLTEALVNGYSDGVWGGKTPKERRSIINRQRREARLLRNRGE